MFSTPTEVHLLQAQKHGDGTLLDVSEKDFLTWKFATLFI